MNWETMQLNKKERAAARFVGIYHKMGMVLHNCPICGSMIKVDYRPVFFARAYCQNGCGKVTLDTRKKYRRYTEEELVKDVVQHWNGGEWDR